MGEALLQYEDVRVRFGDTVALEALQFDVAAGQVVGLVGRNGAGKTTALRVAHGMLHPDRGTVRVLGRDPVTEGLAVRREVALMTEESALYPWMRVSEILRLGGKLHPDWDEPRAQSLSRELDLDPNARISALSRGGKAKVSLVLAVASRPKLLLLDDPTAGLDPLVRREILAGVLGGLTDEGGAVLYASHLIGDVERVAERVAFLDGGMLRAEGEVDELKKRIVRASAIFPDLVPEDLLPQGSYQVDVDGRVAEVVSDASPQALAEELRARGAQRVDFTPMTLEDILVAMLRRNKEAGHV